MIAGMLRFVGLQAGWFACVLGAASGRPLLGVAAVATLFAIAMAASRDRAGLLLAVAAAVALGFLVDGSLTLGGILVFPPQAALGWPVPLWMLALWVNFALSLDAFAWLASRPALAGVVGAAGGAASYLAGARLGAVTLRPDEATALAVVAMLWALAMPLLVCVVPAFAAERLGRGRPETLATEHTR
jgi:hypothetical protein